MTTCRIILLLLVNYTTGSFAAFIGQNNRRTAVDLVTTNLSFHSYFHHRYGFASMISSSDDVSIVRSNKYKYPIDPLSFQNFKLEVSEKLPQG